MTNLRVRTNAGDELLLESSDLEALRATLRGPLLLAGDAGYDAARAIFNAMTDHRPALIVRPAAAADVITAVRFARERDVLLSIRGGGHNVSGRAVCDGGLMIDPSATMNSIRVDPGARTVRAEPGVLGAELDSETQAFGLATPVGTVSTTGIAGLTLGGGQSWLASKHGMAIDNLLSVDIVTADGTLRTASAGENEDLFRAAARAAEAFRQSDRGHDSEAPLCCYAANVRSGVPTWAAELLEIRAGKPPHRRGNRGSRRIHIEGARKRPGIGRACAVLSKPICGRMWDMRSAPRDSIHRVQRFAGANERRKRAGVLVEFEIVGTMLEDLVALDWLDAADRGSRDAVAVAVVALAARALALRVRPTG